MADSSIKVPKDLFKNVKFYLAEEGNDQVKDLLKQGGATREFFFSKLATHVVTSTADFPEYQQAKDSGTPMIKPEWVIYSVKCEAMMPTSAFSIENNLFSNVVACPSQIPPDDRDALWAMITFYGGRCQTTFDATCTHLLVPKPDSEKYECALQNVEKVKIVIPEWVLDCINAKKILDESKYAPVAEPDTQSQSILTPDNEGQTTGAVVNANVEGVLETPSSLLSPESPALSKLKTAENKESDSSPKKTASEKLDLTNDNKTAEVSNQGVKTRPGRHAAETAKQALKDLVKDGPVDGLDPKDDDCSDMDEMKENNNGNTGKDSTEVKEKESGSGSRKSIPFHKEIIISKLLSGCVFFIDDYKFTVSHSVLNTWEKVIRQHAGDIADTYSDKVTHVLCSHQHGEHFRKALLDGKRMVTCYWLNDVILEKKLYKPQTALHLPVPFKDKVSRCRNMIITVSGFEGKQREILKDMISLIGAKYTTYLSRSGTHLVSHNVTSEKYKKAKEWRIPIVNARWLCDIMSGGCDYPVNMKRYLIYGSDNELDINIILARELLEAWKEFEEKEDIMDKKRKLEMLEREMQEYEEAKRARLEEQTSSPKSMDSCPASVRVLFTGLNLGSVRRLTEKLTALGGDTATSIRTCTHIVASKIMRTIKFLTGISVCRYIVSPLWIDKCHEEGRFVDEKDYILHDEEGEKLYGMSLPQSIERAQAKPLFKGMTIYSTANVRPEQSQMAEILDCAGGTLSTELPPKSSLKSLAEQKTEDGHPTFVCVTCEQDTHLCKDMKMAGIGVHNVEFVLSGILKQQLDFYRYKF